MLCPSLFSDKSGPRHLLCLGAHCDDIEIGCGGTLLSLLASHQNTTVTWVVFASTESRKLEAEVSARMFAQNADDLRLKIHGFRDGYLPYSGGDVKQALEQVKADITAPDLILTHYRHDLHQDHRLVSELTWNTFRNHLILEYEIPKWDGDLGSPNTYMPLTKEIAYKKIDLLHQAYASQLNKHWFTRDLFWSMMRIRGMESNSPSSVAEAFYSRKLVFNP